MSSGIEYSSPSAMAQKLVKRHSDIGFIRSYILTHYDRAPSREAIEKLRAEHLASVEREQERLKCHSETRRLASERRRELERRAQAKARKSA